MTTLSEYTDTDTVILADVTVLAHNLMYEHGLIEKGWFFTYDRAKRRFGQCNYTLKQISMSKLLTPSRTLAEIRDTILHEIAHALVGYKHGHDDVWKAKAIAIGSNGKRCGGEVVDGPEFPWYASCDECGHRTGMHRAPGRVRSCSKCCPWGFSWQHVLSWEHNGETAYVDDMPAKFQREYHHMLDVYGAAVVN